MIGKDGKLHLKVAVVEAVFTAFRLCWLVLTWKLSGMAAVTAACHGVPTGHRAAWPNTAACMMPPLGVIFKK